MTIHIHCCADVSYHCYYLALRDAFPLFQVCDVCWVCDDSTHDKVRFCW